MNLATKDIFIYDQSDRQTSHIRHISPTGVIRTIAAAPKGDWSGKGKSTRSGGWAADGLVIAEGNMQFVGCCGSGSLAMNQDTGFLYLGNTYDSTIVEIKP